jgi:hypothetical protein
MRNIRSGLLSLLLAISTVATYSQQSVSLKTGVFNSKPLQAEALQGVGNRYLFYQADRVLTTNEREVLKQKGIEILYALKDNLYWVRVSRKDEEPEPGNLFELPVAYKLGVDIHDRSNANRFRLSVAPGLTEEEILNRSLQHQMILTDTRALAFGFVDVDISLAHLDSILAIPWVSYISALP